MKEKCSYIYMVIFILLSFIICFYNVLFDICLIMFILLDSYLLGSVIRVKAGIFEKAVMQTALGLGIIGLVIYYVLLAGIGSKSVYLAILLGIFALFSIYAVRNESTQVLIQKIYETAVSRYVFGAVLIGILAVYIIYASAPIHSYDALTKHFPISVYAAEYGKWHTNVTESIVYGESMVLYYTFVTIFVSFGVYKAAVLFNAVLYWIAFFILAYFVKRVYSKTNLWILMTIYFTTPFFLLNATVPYLEVLSYFFMISSFMVIYDFNRKKIWENIEYSALLYGFSIFVKLTNLFLAAILSLVSVFFGIRYAYQQKTKIWCRICRCLLFGILPFAGSLINIWMKTGNPVYPNMNAVFKSAYFPIYNFQDPFQNKLGFTLESLIDIVFHTDKNIEMYPLGMGIYLLFLFTVPIALLILVWKKQNFKNYFLWTAIVFLTYGANTAATYNLRYHFSNWITAAGIVTIAVSIIISQITRRGIYFCFVTVVSGMLLFPNLNYLENHENGFERFKKSNLLTEDLYCMLLSHAPSGKSVLSITNRNQVKGFYQGYFASTSWHNCLLDYIKNGTYTWAEYISSFDYVLVDNLCDMKLIDKKFSDILEPLLGAVAAENPAGRLYQVNPEKETIVKQDFDTPVESSVTKPVFAIIPEMKTKFFITEEITNETNESIPMRFQINWMDQNEAFITTTIVEYNAQPGTHEYSSPEIESNSEAAYGLVYVCPADEQEVKVVRYKVEGMDNILEELADEL